jgi:nucleoside-triphosphatase
VRSVVAVTGARGSGKTTALLHLAGALRPAGVRVGGVVQPVVHEGGQRMGYDVLDVASGERLPLARRPTNASPAGCGCGFVFAPDAWSWAAERIRGARRECDVVVADELGSLEAAGNGHLPALEEVLGTERASLWVLGARQDVVGALEARLGAFTLVVERAAELEALLARLVRLARGDDGGARRP